MVYPKKVYFEDHIFLVDEPVYEPAEDTFLLAEKWRYQKMMLFWIWELAAGF